MLMSMKATIPTPTSPALIIQACPRERHKGPHILILTASQRRVPVAIHAKTRHAHPVGQVWSMPAGFFVPTAAFSRQSFLEVWMEMREAVAQTEQHMHQPPQHCVARVLKPQSRNHCKGQESSLPLFGGAAFMEQSPLDKQTSPASPVTSGGQMELWAKCSGTPLSGGWAEDAQLGLPSAPPALKLGMQAKQKVSSGDLCLGGRSEQASSSQKVW
eukprot:1146558-Pelagomonas_calceolata.AAC.4